MHAHHIEAAVNAAVDGSAVYVFAATHAQAAQLAEQFEGKLPTEMVERVIRRNGNRFVDFVSEGCIYFLSTNGTGQRGLSLDRAYVPIGTSDSAVMAIVPALAVRDGVLIGY